MTKDTFLHVMRRCYETNLNSYDELSTIKVDEIDEVVITFKRKSTKIVRKITHFDL